MPSWISNYDSGNGWLATATKFSVRPGRRYFRETGTVQVRAEERIFNDVEEENEWRIRTSLLAGARCAGPLPQSLRGRGPFLEPMRRT